MLEKKDLIIGNKYLCKITEDYAISQNEPSWAGKVTTLKYTGLFFRSLKDDSVIFAYESDVEPIEKAD
jgi:hypothetical protein